MEDYAQEEHVEGLSGIKSTEPRNGHERIVALRRIKKECSFELIDGVLTDTFSTQHILTVYDNLSVQSRAKYRRMRVDRMALIAYQLLQ